MHLTELLTAERIKIPLEGRSKEDLLRELVGLVTGPETPGDREDVLRAVRERCPEAWLVFRPRPEVEAGRRPGRLPDRVALRDCDHVLHGASLQAAIEAVDEVHALTSEAGFEALLRGRKVVTYGAPFYAGWGLTEDRARFPRRTRRLTLDQLVAGALLVYPHYVDPVSRLPCDAETVVERLAEARRCGATLRSPRPYGWRLATRVFRGLLQAAAQPG